MIWKIKFLEKLKRMNYFKQERGSILVLTVILLPIMFAFLGFGYDFGNIYMHKARLQNVADAAALAGARAYLDSQATDNKDEVDGTVDRANGKLLADSTAAYPEGRNTPDIYSIADNTQTKNRDYSKHKAADKAADNYIYKNIVNLGSTVYSDKWSHYAINSDNAAPKTFYRVGLYEEVPLYFLPIIKSVKSPQIVRAGAIALVEKGTPVAGEGITIDPNSTFSIFDNLFTYREVFHTHHTSDNDSQTVITTFDGDMVYTNEDDADSRFYDYDGDYGKVSHLYKSSGTISNTQINDAVINTFFDTTAYIQVFRDKLNGSHIVYSEENIPSADHKLKTSDINNPDSYLYYQSAPLVIDGFNVKYRQNDSSFLYLRNGEDYYPIDKATNAYVTVQDGDTSYNVCYRALPYHSQGWLFKCAKIGSNYFLLNQNGGITNIYINGDTAYINKSGGVADPTRDTTVGLYNNRFQYYNGIGQWGPNWSGEVSSSDVTGGLFPTEDGQGVCSVQGNGNFFNPSNDKDYEVTTKTSGNIIYVNQDNLQGRAQTIYITVDQQLTGDESIPIYVIIEDNMKYLYIDGSASTRRPIIVVYFGSGTLEFNYEGDHFKGTIYAPYASIDPLKMDNDGQIFSGSIVARALDGEKTGNNAKYEQVNYLANDMEVKAVADQLKNKAQQASALINNEFLTKLAEKFQGITYQENNTGDNIALSVTADNFADMNWYNNLSYWAKQALFRKWKEIYTNESDETKRNLLWLWNGVFKKDVTETSADTLRLINFRTDYQDSDEAGAVVNPFIFLSLDELNAY